MIFDALQDHIQTEQQKICGFDVHVTSITSAEAGALVGRPVGTTWCIETGSFHDLFEISEAGECLREVLVPLLEPFQGETLCVCGIGNVWTVYDRLGPLTASLIPVHTISAAGIPSLFSSLLTLAPGTLGQTNLDTATHISALLQASGASCVLLIDASQAQDVSALSSRIDVSNFGITTALQGTALTKNSLGIPALAVGVPLVTKLACADNPQCSEYVMRTTIQEDVSVAAQIIAYAVLRVAYPTLSKDDALSVLALFGRDVKLPF